MIKKRLIWHIYPSYVLLSVLAMAAVVIAASRIARSFYYERTDQQLTSACRLIVEQLASQPDLLQDNAIDAFCKHLTQTAGCRITVIRADGVVIGDSERNPATMNNHQDREEILEAQAQGVGRSERPSDTLKLEMMYVAVPLTLDGAHRATVRTALALNQVDRALNSMWWQTVWNGLLIAAIAMAAALVISRRISRPLEQIRQSAASWHWDDPQEKRLPSSDISEVDTLIQALNTMKDQLRTRLATIKQQHDEQSTLLACMSEAVLAVDSQKRLIKMNQAAEDLFHIQADGSLGKNIMEVVRNADLLDLVNHTFASGTPEQKDIFLPEVHTHLLGSGSVLHSADGKRLGAVMVLNDITHMRKLERMRRDFVADVSHELRTPITSILGFAETLRTSPVEDDAQRDHFLDIIHRQSIRLQTIVEDLLALSSIENEIEQGQIELRPGHVMTVLRAAVQACQSQADEKQIALEISCPETLQANINTQLLQQAVMNLIGNAIKFSEPDTKVTIVGQEAAGEVVLQVRDRGIGIGPEHHARLFERFYRVDKGRSRRMGGTGLGLAIVKHITLAHQGCVGVESQYGKGSTFSIHLPKGR